MKTIDKITRGTISNLDYSIHEKNIHSYAIVGIIGHITFFLVLGYILDLQESLLLRLACILLYIPFVWFRQKEWRIKMKVFYEVSLWFTLPFFFFYMMLINDMNVVWATSVIFAAVIYAILSKTIIAIPGFIVGIGIATSVHYMVSGGIDIHSNSIGIMAVSILTLTLMSLFKIKVESSYLKHNALKVSAERLNETFSSIIYISSELSMYDDLDTIYHMLIDRLVYMFPEASLALIITTGDSYEFMNQVYHEVSNKEQMLIKKYFPDLVDPYAIKKAMNDTVESNEELDVMREWLVFNKNYVIRNHEGKRRYDINLFLKNTNISDDEINVFNIFMEQFKGSIRTRFQAIELERYATTDQLTGLFNRNSYLEDFKRLTNRKDKSIPFSLVFGDINSLKHINDLYGHTDGDLLIQTCSQIVMDNAGEFYKAYRFGGDEIVIIMEQTSLEEAKKMVDQLAAAFNNQSIVCTNEVTHEKAIEKVSMCFGAACSTEDVEEELLDLADSRMRIQKELYYQKEDHVKYR